jgi:membrane protease subunit HflC
MKHLTAGVIALSALAFILPSALFIVDQNEQALVLSFGKPVRAVQAPGLYVKTPFIENVEYFEKRLLDFDADSKEVISSDQKRLIVDAFVRYRITDPLRFKQTVGNELTMRSRLNSILESSLRQIVGSVSLSSVVSEKRAQLMQQIRQQVNAQAMASGKDSDGKGGFGIEVVDVRIRRADLPPANSEGIYKRMQTEREREAKEFRAQGSEDAQKIRSQAEKERTIILAEAGRKAQVIRGEGESESARIFAEAFGQDADFFQFYRSMQAYKKSLNNQDTTLVLSPSGEFLKYIEKGAK